MLFRSGETVSLEGQGTPRREHKDPPASAPPVPTTASSPPSRTPPPLQRGQRTRQPAAYLKDFICDRITNGGQKSLTGRRTEKLPAKSGSYEHHVNIKFSEGGVGGQLLRLEERSRLFEKDRDVIFLEYVYCSTGNT